MIKRLLLLASLSLPLSMTAFPDAASAQASAVDQASAEKLGECFVLKSTGGDRLALARWLVSALASAPQLKDVATVDAAKKDGYDREMAQLFTRLLTVDCATESKPLFKANNIAGFQVAGEALGRIAMQELLGNKDAAAALAGYVKYLDAGAFKALAK